MVALNVTQRKHILAFTLPVVAILCYLGSPTKRVGTRKTTKKKKKENSKSAMYNILLKPHTCLLHYYHVVYIWYRAPNQKNKNNTFSEVLWENTPCFGCNTTHCMKGSKARMLALSPEGLDKIYLGLGLHNILSDNCYQKAATCKWDCNQSKCF